MHTVPGHQIPAALARFGVELNPEQTDKIQAYLDLLLRWNRRMNLTSIREPDAILSRHFGESLYLTRVVSLSRELVVDVGTGAGFPALPLKIIWPELRIVLVESVGKKVVFLKEVIRTLGLDKVEIQHIRFEPLARQWTHGPADIVTSRAVGNHETLAESGARILGAGGKLILYLGRKDAEAVVRKVTLFRWQDCRLLPTSRERVILLGTKG